MSEFVANLAEVFAVFGRITSRRMFGGHGIYHDGLMFGLVVSEQFYLKADAVSRPQFTALGLPPFSYLRQGKPMQLSYYLAPEDIFDDPDAARYWPSLRRGVARSQVSHVGACISCWPCRCPRRYCSGV